MLNICGRFSLSETIVSIALGDFLFSTASLAIHLTETFVLQHSLRNSQISRGFQCEPTTLVQNSSRNETELENLIHPIPENEKENVETILCWAYVVINVANILLASVLWLAVVRESIVKCISYLVIAPALIIVGVSCFLYHVTMVGLQPYYYAVTMYPCYWVYKVVTLFVIANFLKLIRSSGDKAKKGQRKKEEYYLIGGRNQPVDPLTTTSLTSLVSSGESVGAFEEEEEVPLLPKKFEVAGELLKLDHLTCLGFDDHHSIIRGRLSSSSEEGEMMDVAVKTLKVTTPTIPYSSNLMKEADFLAFIGDHENILRFIGVCRKPDLKGKVFLLMEYFPKGMLEAFLQDCQTSFQSKTFKNLLMTENRILVPSMRKRNELPNFDTIDMIHWCTQIASAMEFLHRKRVIHGCLQAKSIIIVESDCVKVSGFSFAQKLKSKSYILKRDDIPARFPWRWSAVECLTELSSDAIRFSTRTDIWSFAVILWEIFSLGQVPFSNWDSDIVRGLLEGQRLEKPEYASQQIYDIMMACWRTEPLDRPNFFLLRLFFEQFLTSLRNPSTRKGSGWVNE